MPDPIKPTAADEAMARDFAKAIMSILQTTWREGQLIDAGLQAFALHAQQAREQALEEAAKVAECHFDERGNSRAGHHSEMDWTDGYRDGTKAASNAIRALKEQRPC